MPTAALTRADFRAAWIALTAFLGTMALGACADAGPTAASFWGIEGPTCLLARVAGELACPGCGLTRSVALTMHGDFAAAFALHPGGWVVVVACAVGAVVQADILRRRRRTTHHRRWIKGVWIALAVGLVAGWISRLT